MTLLPAGRNTTYTPASPVKSGDLNDIQDCLIGGLHGDVILDLHPCAGFGTATVTSLVTGLPVNFATLGGNGTGWAVAIPVLRGTRLKSVTFARLGNAAADFDAIVSGVAPDGTAITPAGSTITVVDAPAAWADSTIDFTDTDVVDGAFAIAFIPNAAGIQIGPIRVTYSKLS